MIKSFTFYSPKNLFRLLSAWLLLFAVFASGQTQTVDLTSSGTYTVPQGVTALTVEAWGGGGGGGGAKVRTTQTRSGSGGGGGSYSRSVITTLASTYYYSVGIAGSAGENLSGGDGGTTIFGGSSLIYAPGGKGGKRNSGGGGAGGTGAIGTIVFNGGDGATGGNGTSGGGGGSAGGSGDGGDGNGTTAGAAGAGGAFSPGAVGGTGSTNGTNGTPGKSGGEPGAGGSGGIVYSFIGTYPIPGGVGAQGRIRLAFTKPAITITPSSITICKGSSVSLTASSAGAYSYSWSNDAGNGSTVTVSPASTTTYTVTGTASNGAGGTFTHTQTVTVNVNSNATSTASVPSSTPTLCINTLLTPITHTTTGATGIGVPIGLPTGITASWLNNKITISGTPTSAGTFNYSIPLTGGCGAVSATGKIIVNANLPAIVTIASSLATTICAGTSVTFTATPVNGGTAPFYQWKVNGVNAGTNSSTFTTTTLANNDKVTVVMTSNASPCSTGSPATSNALIMIVNPLPAKVTVTGNGQICSGLDAIFTINGTPGAIVTYNINSGSNTTIILPSTGSVEVKVLAATASQVLNIISVSNGTCANDTTSSTTVIVGAVTTWRGKWDNGEPDNNGLSAVIAVNYETSQGNIRACNCTVNPNVTLTISGSTEMVIENNIVNNGTIIVENNGNLKQINDNAVNEGEIIVRRNHTLTTDRKEYNFLSSPVKNQNMKLIFGGVRTNIPFVTVLKESTNAFVNAVTADWGIPARGYAVKEPIKTYTQNMAEYKGPANNGKISIGVSKSGENFGSNVIGNPYPSNLDLKKLYDDNKTVIGPEFKFWDNKVNNTYAQFGGDYKGYSYAVYNAKPGDEGYTNPAPGNDGGENTDGTGNQETDSGVRYPFEIVKISQAFLVKAISTGNVNYKNSYRSTSNKSTTFFGKNTQTTESSFRLQLITPYKLVFTQGIVYYEGGDNEFGAEDSRHPAPSSSDAFYSFAGDEQVIINGRSIFNRSDIIKLGTQNFKPGLYKIKAKDQKGVFTNGQNIYIKDNLLNVIANLNEGPYEFTTTSGAFTNRFEIVYDKGTVLATNSTNKLKLEVYRDAQDFVVQSSAKKITSFELYDLNGRIIISKKANAKEIRFDAKILLEGVYVVKVQLEGSETISKKIRK